jgi:MFS family permease
VRRPAILRRVTTGEPDAVAAAPELATAPPAGEQEHGRAFASLKIPSFRAWFLAQILSGSGTMAQLVGQAWLILHVLHGGGFALGAVAAVGFLPVLLGGAWAGAHLHHVDVRRTLIATQVAAGSVAVTAGVLVVTGAVRLWMVFALAIANGCVSAFDAPARQLYVVELVGRDRVASAVGLYEVILNASRVIGPASGGVVLALAGISACFFANAASYVAPLVVLLRYRPHDDGERSPTKPRTRDTLRAGLAYVRRTPEVAAVLVIAAVSGMIFNTGTSIPVLATQTFGLGKTGLGLLTACFGIGAIPGGLAAAYSRNARLGRRARVLCLASGVAVIALASAPGRDAAFPLMVLVGFLSIWMIAVANTLAQLRPDASLRGPVMGLWTMVLPGLMPVTALVTGATTQYVGPRPGYGIAGVFLCAAALAGWRALADR